MYTQIKRGGIVKASIPGELGPFDPYALSGSPTVMYQIYEPFIAWRPNRDGTWGPAPGLFSSWEAKPGEVVFKLPMHVKFHDGTDWNADSAVWNLERYRSAPQTSHRIDLECIERAEKNDDFSVRVRLRGACASLFAALSQSNVRPPFPISRSAFQKWGIQEYPLNPAGTGPFRLDTWEKEEFLRLKRWDGYWRRGADGQNLPYLAELNIRQEMDDIKRMNGLRNNESHITEMVRGGSIASSPPDNLHRVEGPWIGYSSHIIFNSRQGVFANNNRLRQAMLTSLDREGLVKNLAAGVGIPLRYVLLPGSLAYDERAPAHKYDQTIAHQMMREAGYPNGIDFNLDYMSSPFDEHQVKALAGMWEVVRLKAYSISSRTPLWTSRVVEKGLFEAAVVRVPVEGDPALDMAHYLSGTSPISGHRYANQDLDRCLREANQVLEAAQRKDIYRRCQTLAYNDAYRGFLWAQTWNWALRGDVKGFMPSWGSNWELAGVWLDN
jgi:peptide/nickel transport system substrate-binding protein